MAKVQLPNGHLRDRKGNEKGGKSKDRTNSGFGRLSRQSERRYHSDGKIEGFNRRERKKKKKEKKKRKEKEKGKYGKKNKKTGKKEGEKGRKTD